MSFEIRKDRFGLKRSNRCFQLSSLSNSSGLSQRRAPPMTSTFSFRGEAHKGSKQADAFEAHGGGW